MKSVLAIILAAIPYFSSAQNCKCLDDFYFVKNHIETNHPGFNKNIRGLKETEYDVFVNQLEQNIKSDTDNKYCIIYLKKYIAYLKDHHSGVEVGEDIIVNEDSLPEVEAFYKSSAYRNTEMINIDSSLLSFLKKTDTKSIEGIYNHINGNYTVAVIKDKTAFRDYAGIIIESKTRLWKKGQVKFELKQINDSLMDVYLSQKNHSIDYEPAVIKKGVLQLDKWEKQYNSVNSQNVFIDEDLIRFVILDSTTTLLSIRSFEIENKKQLDSAYKKIIPQIKKYKHLIIDVRNNGGGSDYCFQKLMPLLYTNPIIEEVMDLYNTPANLKAYQDRDSFLVKSGIKKTLDSDEIRLMKKSKPFTFVHMGKSNTSKTIYKKNNGYPEKIAVLYNRECASTCEGFLLEARFSKKTILVGENSGGYVGYGNVSKISTPCGNILRWTTTVFRDRYQYEFVGIPPYYYVPDDETNWVDYIRRLFFNK